MRGKHRRRWTNIKPTLSHRLVLVGRIATTFFNQSVTDCWLKGVPTPTGVGPPLNQRVSPAAKISLVIWITSI